MSSLSYLPPTRLPKNSKVISSNAADFVFTVNQKGLCKVYSVGVELVEVGRIDFSQDAGDEINDALETKKYIGQLINFEITKSKSEASISNGVPLNIKKDKLKPTKGTDVINKPKPKKGAKPKSKKVAKAHIFDEEV